MLTHLLIYLAIQENGFGSRKGVLRAAFFLPRCLGLLATWGTFPRHLWGAQLGADTPPRVQLEKGAPVALSQTGPGRLVLVGEVCSEGEALGRSR